jgi:hypothetical protein
MGQVEVATPSASTLHSEATYRGSSCGQRARIDGQTGKPLSTPTNAFTTVQAVQYVLDDTAYITFDLNDDGVQCIFIGK